MSNRINFLPPWVETNLQPAFYDLESGTSLQQTARMYAKVNQLVRSVNEQNETIDEYIQQFIDLRNFVDDYFDNLDVQEEINKKLDAMVADGTIKSIINNEIFGEINAKVLQNTLDISANTEAIEGKVSEGEADTITMSMLTQDVREAMTGGSTAVVGTDSVGTENIKDKAVTIYKLDDYLQANKVIEYDDPMDLGVEGSGIIIENGSTHKISVSGAGSTTYGWYKVALTKDKWYCVSTYNNYTAGGVVLADSDDNVLFNTVTDTSAPLAPIAYIFKATSTGMNAYLNVTHASGVPAPTSFLRRNAPSIRPIKSIENKVKAFSANLIKTISGTYPSITSDNVNVPLIATYANCDTHVYEMSKGVRYHILSNDWSQVVGLYILKLDNTIIYQSSDTSVGNNYVPIDYTFTAQQDGYILVPTIVGHVPTVEVIQPFATSAGGSSEELTFSKWFALGDSLTEVNFRASDNYVSYITDELDITTVNLGKSGAGYKKESSDNKTFTSEIDGISNYNYNTDIITVMGSINDFTYISDLGELGDTTNATIYGAMYVFFNTLQTAYMGTRLGVITPPVTGNTYNLNKENFAKYNKALKDTAELFGVPVLDLTYSCNLKPWESNFRNEFYSADGTGASGQVDSTHPNSKGHWLIHNKIKEFLKTL